MNLLINPISVNIDIFAMDGVDVRHKITLEKGDDFSSFPEAVIKMMNSYAIEEIWCIVGPGAFTRMRIVTLTLNSIKLTRKIELRGCHFFDTIDNGLGVLRANDREYIVENPDGSTGLIDIGDIAKLVKETYIGYGDKNDFTEGQNFIEYDYNFAHIVSLFHSHVREKTLSPIYLKDPHITWSKKNTSLS